jgi:hypothetical protein
MLAALNEHGAREGLACVHFGGRRLTDSLHGKIHLIHDFGVCSPKVVVRLLSVCPMTLG